MVMQESFHRNLWEKEAAKFKKKVLIVFSPKLTLLVAAYSKTSLASMSDSAVGGQRPQS